MLVWIVHRLIWVTFQPIVSTFVGQVILNRKKMLETKTPLIFVSNHESHFDPFLISGTTPLWGGIMPIRFFTRDIFFEQPIFRRVLWLLGAFPGNIGFGTEKAIQRPLAFLRAGYSVGIFPEWCFPTEPEATRMQSVAPVVSQKSGAPIIPVFLFGIDGLRWRKIFFQRKKNIISFGDPIYPDVGESPEQYAERLHQGLLAARLECIRYLKQEERKFWSSYAKFYQYLELAAPYQRMLETLGELLPEHVAGKWLDIGTGSGAMVQLLLGKSGKAALEIIATDFNEEMLKIAEDRFRDDLRIRVEKLDLNERISYRVQSFHGIVANLVLPYITHQGHAVGQKVFTEILEQLFHVLKPGGTFVFSTPKHGVNFVYVALGSWKSFFDRQHPEYRSYAFHILRHALQIQEWGRREVYNFFPLAVLEQLVHAAGFRDIQIKNALVGQVYIVSCRKPTSTPV